MKIGLVRRGYSASGGAERYLRRFAAGLREAGHDAVLFASREWPAEAWDGDLIRVDGEGPRRFADGLAKARPRDHCDLVFSLERVWECDAYRAGDGVHQAWLDRRAAFDPRWKAWFRARQGKHRETLELERAAFDPAADRLMIANSRMVAREIERYFHIPPRRLRVIHNGLPPSSFILQTSSFPSGAPPTVLFAGSGWERKGLRFAIEAINRTPGATLLVAGAGRRAGLPYSRRTRFLGEVKEMRELMAGSDVFVLPTIYDPFSNAALEAMAAGLPVITTEANGFAEVMRPGKDGEVLANPGDVAGIAAAIQKWAARETAATREDRRREAGRHTIAENVRATVEALTEFENRRKSGG